MKTETANIPNAIAALINAAKAAQSRSYAPYSNFKVGAAIETDDNQTYLGCNVENAAYPLSQCAEATAIGNMITGGSRKITRVVIVGSSDDFCYPCGGCRQKIAEFASADTEVIMIDKHNTLHCVTLAELLPHTFHL